jgi:hypothetical protein
LMRRSTRLSNIHVVSSEISHSIKIKNDYSKKTHSSGMVVNLVRFSCTSK